MGATCTDAKGNVVTLNRGTMLPIEKGLAPEIRLRSSSSIRRATWSRRGAIAACRPKGFHGCFFDYENNFWLGGSGDGIVQKWARDGSKMLLQIGTKGKCDGPDGKCVPAQGSTPVTPS
jgi:hypothetical protein